MDSEKTSSPKIKILYKILSLDEKYQVIKNHANLSNRKLAELFKISEGTVRNILKQKKEIINEFINERFHCILDNEQILYFIWPQCLFFNF